MKVLEVNTEKTWRGGERQTLYTCKGLLDAGCEVSLLCLKGNPLAQKAKEEGVETIEVASNFSAWQYLVSNSGKYDIVHVQTAKAQTLAVFSKFFHKTPVVYTRRVDFQLKSGGLSLWKYKKTDKLVAISNAIRQIMEKQELTNISVIPSVVIKKHLNKQRAEEFLDKLNLQGKKVVATIAAMVPHKDPLTMVSAIKELKSLRDDFVFLHFGDGELMEEVKTAIELNDLKDVYYPLGYIEGVEDFYAVFDVFVMSSQEEGLGSSVLDAFLYQVPVASTDAGGLKETVEGRGLLSPMHDAKALAQNISKLLDNAELSDELRQRAYQEVKEKYTLEYSTQEYLKLFRSLIGS